MGRTDVAVISPAAVQVVVDPVKPGLFQHQRLLFSKKADGAAEMRSLFFHLADLRSKFFNLFIGKFHTAESDTVSGQMMFIYKIIVFI